MDTSQGADGSTSFSQFLAEGPAVKRAEEGRGRREEGARSRSPAGFIRQLQRGSGRGKVSTGSILGLDSKPEDEEMIQF